MNDVVHVVLLMLVTCKLQLLWKLFISILYVEVSFIDSKLQLKQNKQIDLLRQAGEVNLLQLSAFSRQPVALSRKLFPLECLSPTSCILIKGTCSTRVFF